MADRIAENFDGDHEIVMNQAEPGFGFDRAICHETHAIILSVCKSGGLAAAMVGIGFLDPDAEGLHHGEIVERKEEGFFGKVEIDMIAPQPSRPEQEVVRWPVETRATED